MYYLAVLETDEEVCVIEDVEVCMFKAISENGVHFHLLLSEIIEFHPSPGFSCCSQSLVTSHSKLAVLIES